MRAHVRRLTVALAAVTLATGALVGPAGVADARERTGHGSGVTRCSALPWQARDVVVDGDLLVDGPCELTDSVVHGDVRVLEAEGSYLLLRDSTVDGTLRVAGSVQVYGSDLGAIRLRAATAVVLAFGSTVAGDVTGPGQWLELADVHVLGDVRSSAFETDLERATVDGDVRITDGWTWILDSTLGGSLQITRPPFGVIVCGTDVAGGVTVRDAAAAVDVGPRATCPTGPDAPTTTVGGTLTLLRNVGPVRVGDVRVAGDLVCRANVGGVAVLDGVTVDGTRRGQCAGRPTS
ncbi:hypothetical protein GXP71_14940 [Cellulomonas sp. H30R-01]|uniref:hypothetical protein n=1 Tax=Cellulomonas sp. H30R-01 TaxID=2704467 RepID=UPI00138C4092|nr:hypothetical protein [Cellulomonas sp. H30R-01]QHT57243.1 hypothetical protein GXP71_14940 [Cellulomonas sp. H30R-01]